MYVEVNTWPVHVFDYMRENGTFSPDPVLLSLAWLSTYIGWKLGWKTLDTMVVLLARAAVVLLTGASACVLLFDLQCIMIQQFVGFDGADRAARFDYMY